MEYRHNYIRLLSPVIIFGIVLLSGLITLEGFYNYNTERNNIEDYSKSKMEALILRMEVKVSGVESVLISESHKKFLEGNDKKSIFESLENFLEDQEIITNACLDICDEAGVGIHSGSPSEIYYVGRNDKGGFERINALYSDSEVTPDELECYFKALKSGEPTWSMPYCDSILAETYVLTCYKKCEEDGVLLSADIELSDFLQNVDSLNVYKGSKMYVVTEDDEVFTSDATGGEVAYLGYAYKLQESLREELKRSIMVSACCESLGLEVYNIIPKSEIFPSLWWKVLLVLLVCILGINVLAFAIYKIFRKAQHDLEVSVREATDSEMELKKIEHDISIAARIQNRMLSSPGRCEHFRLPEGGGTADVMSQIIPAREVGGDLYEYRLVGDNLVICIADVSGKGIPASVMMTMCCTLFNAFVSYDSDTDPADLLGYMNTQLCRRNSEMMFATMWAGALNLRTGVLKYSSAGHNPPVVISEGAAFMKLNHGTPLGLFDDAVFETMECTLAPGDSLVLYTDGITEAENSAHDLFGDGSLLEVCRDVCSRSPQVICDAILEAVHRHAAGALQSDDMTLLCITRGAQIAGLQGIDDVSALHRLADECGDSFLAPLALEELAVNAFDHGGASFVSAEYDGGIYTLTDDGAAFDPTEYVKPEDNEEDSIGGRGIELARKASSEFTWRRSGRYNTTRLKIKDRSELF